MTKNIYIGVGALLLIGLFAWWAFSPRQNTPAANQPGGNSAGQYSNQTSVGVNNPQTNIEQSALPDIAAAYTALFQQILADKVEFAAVSDTSGTNGALYKLYAADIAQFKKLFPRATNFTIHVGMYDLNDDNTQEALVREDMPGYCGTAGCPLDIYVKKGGSWSLLYSTLVQGEVGVSNTSVNNYRDLYLTVPGPIAYQSEVIRYSWDGKSYQAGQVMAYWDGSTFTTIAK